MAAHDYRWRQRETEDSLSPTLQEPFKIKRLIKVSVCDRQTDWTRIGLKTWCGVNRWDESVMKKLSFRRSGPEGMMTNRQTSSYFSDILKENGFKWQRRQFHYVPAVRMCFLLLWVFYELTLVCESVQQSGTLRTWYFTRVDAVLQPEQKQQFQRALSEPFNNWCPKYS